ncbi:hypothetical protein AXF42_Ash021189 [Apostasia shenzhenica]|uniref:Uncharacterized protein n=1 Tax=Apostasia shenzhenica TaxID=1088818 RepID=A0A2I0AXB4_9ASPA|nr:hypothetical protein AXF42_Ash021189 [Apostasia shenzhenica]
MVLFFFGWSDEVPVRLFLRIIGDVNDIDDATAVETMLIDQSRFTSKKVC